MVDSHKLGGLLKANGLIDDEALNSALERQRQEGGLLGDSLIALGLVTAEQIQAVLHSKPKVPRSLEDTGIKPALLLNLLIRTVLQRGLETVAQMADALALPSSLMTALVEDAVERKYLASLGADGGAFAEQRYALSEAGRRLGKELLDECQYVGAAPVSLEAYHNRVLLQRITNEQVGQDRIEASLSEMVVTEDFIHRLGPAINSGQSILLYGPPGNGKTSVAERIGRIFADTIYIPYCVEIDGQIMKVFDPSVHKAVETEKPSEGEPASVKIKNIDKRWVACRRPLVVVGGELTLEMLDLDFNAIAKSYEAPMHVKALGGTFIIDDFGRQMVSPADLLNRWIVPLESRVDYLKLHTGKSFSIPFDELVIFSTNMSPGDLMDPAFLRRIPYKLRTEGPTVEDFRRIFELVSKQRALTLDNDTFSLVLDRLRDFGDMPLACYQPKFVAEQVLAACKFRGIAPQYSPELVSNALDNLFVTEEPPTTSVAKAA